VEVLEFGGYTADVPPARVGGVEEGGRVYLGKVVLVACSKRVEGRASEFRTTRSRRYSSNGLEGVGEILILKAYLVHNCLFPPSMFIYTNVI
jgi:hypothetical protein